MKKCLALVALLLAACGQNDDANTKTQNVEDVAVVDEAAQGSELINLTINDHRHEINAAIGQEVEVTLDANATTGYRWSFVTYVNEDDAVEELKDDYIPNENPDGKVGVGGQAIYRIKLLKAGDVYVTANYSRDEGLANKENADDDFSVKLVVK